MGLSTQYGRSTSAARRHLPRLAQNERGLQNTPMDCTHGRTMSVMIVLLKAQTYVSHVRQKEIGIEVVMTIERDNTYF
ncbi:hypothetical protein EJD97_014536 [Solanum chilense]|uniref:Uncharacterized protein n=1 Tax=Solanum chilense TaxID=4083 RepID=A0A6N2AGK5_SOLCI|nr:hypothetical protein EJD97_014536 [Solanum chilense]